MFWFSPFLGETCSIILWSMKTCFCHLGQKSPEIDNQIVNSITRKYGISENQLVVTSKGGNISDMGKSHIVNNQ